jgi:hypothetical protein
VQSLNAALPVTLNGSIDGDTVTIDDGDASAAQTYILGAGNLQRGVPVTSSAFLSTGQVNYSGIEKLVVNAGSGDDTFQMTNTAQPVLQLNGDGGTNTIDYSSFPSNVNVTVNLGRGEATKVSKLSNVQNATGGDGDDTLVGNGSANVLNGQGGRDVIIGGEGADVIRGGAGEDLMIAGRTDFDLDRTALATISSTWAGTGKAQDRANTLKTGGTGVTLSDNGTVHDDVAIDQLFSDDDGPNTTDWIWADSTQDVFTLDGNIFK